MEYQESLSKRVASKFFGSTLEVPSEMFDEMTRWVSSKIAADRYAYALESFEKKQEWIKEIEDDLRKYPDDDHSSSMRYLERYQRESEILERELSETMTVAKSYPSIRLRSWTKAKRVFRIDLSGLSYAKKLSKNEIQRGLDVFPSVTLVLANKSRKSGKAVGVWRETSSTINLTLSSKKGWRTILRHELQHFVQSFMNQALRIDHFGLPSERNIGLSQNHHSFRDVEKGMLFPGYEKIKKMLGVKSLAELRPYLEGLSSDLKSKGVTVKDFHDLDDVEFYTELGDSINKFEREYSGLSREYRSEALKRYVGFSGTPESPFFEVLFRGSRGKWKKAVKEITKAVL